MVHAYVQMKNNSFNKYLLNTYRVPDSVLGTGDKTVNKNRPSRERPYILVGETDNKYIRSSDDEY